MKKIALCSLSVLLCTFGAYASVIKGADCRREFSPGNNNWSASSKEYLFPTEEDYFKVVNRGTVYECDDSQCGDGTYVEMPDGHFFGGFEKKHAFYKCSLGANDKWEKIQKIDGLTKCTKSYKKWGRIGATSDEYLYPTKSDWDAVSKSEYGLVYECDSNVCPQGTEITLGSVHYFGKEKVTGPRRYVCKTDGGNDYWMPMKGLCNGKDCEDSEEQPVRSKQCTYNGRLYNVGQFIDDNLDCSTLPDQSPYKENSRTGKKCYRTCVEKTDGNVVTFVSVKECPQDKPTPVNFDSSERALYKTALSGYKKCEKNGGSNQTCEQQFPNGTPERLACCRAGKATKWIDGKCECVDANKQIDPNKEWKYTAGERYGQCVEKNGGNNVTPQKKCSYVFTADFMCSNGTRIKANTRYDSIDLPSGVAECSEFESLLATDRSRLEALKAQYCVQYGPTVILPTEPTGPSSDDIKKAKDNLKKFTDAADSEKADVWKNAEGKFNTARLASDLTAGVVLGTVGGVVSGVVITKTQKEKGFEALHCTVGGQKMADWGDVFQVNFRR